MLLPGEVLATIPQHPWVLKGFGVVLPGEYPGITKPCDSKTLALGDTRRRIFSKSCCQIFMAEDGDAFILVFHIAPAGAEQHI